MNDESLFIKCQCSSHCLEIERYCYDKNDDGFYITIWDCFIHNKKLTWKERIKWVWKIISTGNLWADSIIINNKQAEEIVKHIKKHLLKRNSIYGK